MNQGQFCECHGMNPCPVDQYLARQSPPSETAAMHRVAGTPPNPPTVLTTTADSPDGWWRESAGAVGVGAQSNTPRTDAATVNLREAISTKLLPSGKNVYVDLYVPADFARTLERELAERDSIIRGLSGVLRKESDDLATATAHANGLTDLIRRMEGRLETAENQFAALRQHFDDACAVVGLSKESSEPLAAAIERKLAEAHKDAERYLKLSIELEAALAAGRKG